MSIYTFVSKAGKTYEIDVDDLLIRVSADGTAKGSIGFDFVEGMPERGMPHSYLIVDLALEGCKREGVGRECLRLHKEEFDAPIQAGPDDGSRPDDGSYLIDDGAGFIAKMREEGLVERSRSSAYDENPSDRFDRDDDGHW